jgi:hypothetical protein
MGRRPRLRGTRLPRLDLVQRNLELRKVSLGACGRPTGRPAHMNMHVYAAQYFRWIRSSDPASSRSSGTSETASLKLGSTAGAAKSKACKSASMRPTRNLPASTAVGKTAAPAWWTSPFRSSQISHAPAVTSSSRGAGTVGSTAVADAAAEVSSSQRACISFIPPARSYRALRRLWRRAAGHRARARRQPPPSRRDRACRRRTQEGLSAT